MKTAPPSTEENISLPEEAPVQVVTFDLVGREVRPLVITK